MQIVLEPDFMPANGCRYLLDQARPLLPAKGSRHQATGHLCPPGTSFPNSANWYALDVAAVIAARCGVPADWLDQMQVQVYESGDLYTPHFDAFDEHNTAPDQFARGKYQRTWSALVYLEAAARGGETEFPAIGLSITPRPGLLVYWYNLTFAGEVDPASLHRALPVIDGEKAVLTLWFRDRRKSDEIETQEGQAQGARPAEVKASA